MKFLRQPVNPFYINQSFADNRACVSNKDNKTVKTKRNNETCPAGFRSLYGAFGHNGLDLMAKHGQPVYSSFDGWVEEIQTEEARGLGLGIISTELYPCTELKDKLVQFKARYWHLKSFEVERGQPVKKGQLIGYADNTGYSSGDHLHYELKPVELVGGEPRNLLQNNGFYGAVDPMPYMESDEEAFDREHPELDKEVTREQYNYRQSLFRRFYKLFTGRDYK